MSAIAADFRDPQFSSDGKSLIFENCSSNTCLVQVYNLETGDLGFYQPPPGTVWRMASPSRDGSKLVLVSFPDSVSEKDAKERLRQAQIMVVNTDGSGLRALTSHPGLKTYPSFSRAGDRVLFNQAAKLRDSGATVAAGYELWEADVAAGTSRLFAGPFDFYGAGRSYYIGDGPDALVNADGPSSQIKKEAENNFSLGLSRYLKRTNNSQIYRITRGSTTLDDPLFIELSSPQQAAQDTTGAVFFVAEHPKRGTRFWTSRAGGIAGEWPPPTLLPGSDGVTYRGISVSPDGNLVALIARESSGRRDIGRVSLLDVAAGQWRDIAVPESARRINP